MIRTSSKWGWKRKDEIEHFSLPISWFLGDNFRQRNSTIPHNPPKIIVLSLTKFKRGSLLLTKLNANNDERNAKVWLKQIKVSILNLAKFYSHSQHIVHAQYREKKCKRTIKCDKNDGMLNSQSFTVISRGTVISLSCFTRVLFSWLSPMVSKISRCCFTFVSILEPF